MICVRTLFLLTIAAGITLGSTAVPGQEIDRLEVLTGGYPRAYFFRAAEGMASNQRVSYQRWEGCFSRLMGIEGKVLDEEVPGRSVRNVEFFTRFKKDHPEQLVLLHYNGNARDPRYQVEKFFAGHWLYFNGAKILRDVPAEAGETEIHVEDPSLFRVNTGRYRTSNEDIGLCLLDTDGRPDWHHSEQVELIAVDMRRETIRVRRACHGTRARAFPAGGSYAAAHMSEGPWGHRSNLLWHYNYSKRCPLDEDGCTCADVLCRELAGRFLPSGELAAFDGLEFDVLHHRAGRSGRLRGPDCDADGQGDGGLFDGVNSYGVGVVEFCRKLRQKLGPGKLILADGMSLGNQRAFGILNGIESEGWPSLNDWEIRDWSGGLNRHRFWGQNGHPPVFNYVNHKFVTRGEEPGTVRRPDVPFHVHRLVLAAAVLTDSAVCYSFAPPKEPKELLGIWDELRGGEENRPGWLGRPLGTAVRLAAGWPDVLRGRGSPIGCALLEHATGQGVRLVVDKDELKVTALPGANQNELRFRLHDVPCTGPDLFVMLTARGRPLRGCPAEMARLAWLGIAAPEGDLVRAELPSWGICPRGGQESELDEDSGGTVRWIPRRKLGDEAHNAYLVHPPYKDRVGYTFWHRDVLVPDGGRLEFFTGMGEKSPRRSDGVTFRVLVGEMSDRKTPQFKQVFEHTQVESSWIPHRVDLGEWAGRRVRLKFISDCGPNDKATTDHSHWGDVAVLGPEGRKRWTTPARFMTWLNDRPFTSGFYFANVKSKTVDLEWVVEGTEPIWISSFRVFCHPDAMMRQFEHGAVLANPSPRPYTFDLARLAPGRKFRRLKGSKRQDPTANNGSPVGDTVQLGPLEGLFLISQ